MNQTLPMAVGRFLARCRRDHGLTLDQIAQAAREYGASWSPSSVRNIERGEASLPVPTLIMLTLAINDLTHQNLRLADLLGDMQKISLTPEARPLRRSWFDAVLTGKSLTLGADDYADGGPQDEESASPHSEPSVEEQWQDIREKERIDALSEEADLPFSVPTVAERRGAKKLSMEPGELQAWARRLWNRPLEVESLRRAGTDSSPQRRGRMTRFLLDEIEEAREQQQRSAEEEKERDQQTWLEDEKASRDVTSDLTSREHAREIEDAQKADPF